MKNINGRPDNYKSHCSKFFIFELLILIICPLPRLEAFITIDYVVEESPKLSYARIAQPLSDYILAFMFLRLFFVFRSIFNYSIYTDPYSK